MHSFKGKFRLLGPAGVWQLFYGPSHSVMDALRSGGGVVYHVSRRGGEWQITYR